MSDEKVMVYTTNQNFQAEMLKTFLADNGIKAFLLNKKDSSYLIGDIEIWVNSEDVIRARYLINKFES